VNFIIDLFKGTDVTSTLLYISLTAFVGILIGKIAVKKVKLGIAGVLFSGLLFAHFGLQADPAMLHFTREFGLILFVYAIGIDVGPRFFSTFRKDGLILNLFAVGIVVTGFFTAYLIYSWTDVSPEVITGIMSGAVTNTPGLGAAQQVLSEMGKTQDVALTGMAYALAYPFGVLGVILTMIVVRWIFGIKINKEVEDYNNRYNSNRKQLESVEIHITNPSLFGKDIGYIKKIADTELVISQIGRNNTFIVASEKEILQEGDVIYGVSSIDHLDALRLKMGDVKVGNKRKISGNFAMFHVLITNRKLAGKTIEQIGIYRRYEANITRIFRAGMEILPTLRTTVELGDTVRIVGKRDLLPDIRQELGNSVKELSHPNTAPIFLGIFLGIVLGSIPIIIPGLPVPAKLGLAGGPLLIAIILGHQRRIGKLDFYMTPGANMIIRELGIVLFLSCVGLSSGGKFVQTLVNGGYVWLLYGAAITVIPIFLAAIIARAMKMNYLKICGILSGAMTDPPALEFANSLAPVHAQSITYATVYPLTMFLRILLAQILILITL